MDVAKYLQIYIPGTYADGYYIISFDSFDEFYSIYMRLESDEDIELIENGNFSDDGDIAPYEYEYDDTEILLLGNMESNEYLLKIKDN